MKEKFEIIAENLHLKGITKYIALGIFLIIILFISSKLLSIKPKEKEKQVALALKSKEIVNSKQSASIPKEKGLIVFFVNRL